MVLRQGLAFTIVTFAHFYLNLFRIQLLLGQHAIYDCKSLNLCSCEAVNFRLIFFPSLSAALSKKSTNLLAVLKLLSPWRAMFAILLASGKFAGRQKV